MISATTSALKVRFRDKDRNTEFVVELKRRVNHYFVSRGLSPYANREMYLHDHGFEIDICILATLS